MSAGIEYDSDVAVFIISNKTAALLQTPYYQPMSYLPQSCPAVAEVVLVDQGMHW